MDSEKLLARLLAAIEAWSVDPSAENEQGILDARDALVRGAPTPENGLREALERIARGREDGRALLAYDAQNIADAALQHNSGERDAESVEREIAGTVPGLPRDLRRAYVESNGNWQTVANAASQALSQAPR